jgi:hypothetical protein
MSHATKTDIIQAFVEGLPNSSDLEPQSTEFWNRLRVWHERVISERLRDANLVQRYLNSLGKGLLQALCLWVGLPIDTATIAQLVETLKSTVIADPSQTWCQDLLLLMEFLQGKNHEAITTIGHILLPESTARMIDSSVFTSNGRRLGYAMHVYYQNPVDLALLLLFEKAERSGHTRCVLVPQAEEGGQAITENEAERAALRIQEGIDFSALTMTELNQALKAFETKRGNSRRSICERILQESDESTLVFIYRVLREASIPETDRTLFGDEAETIVLRFGHRLRSLEEHSAKHIGTSIAGTIASHLLEAKVEYIDDTDRTTRQAVDSLLNTTLKGEDDRLRLVEVYVSQSPLEGSPILIVRCNKSESLAPALGFLEDRQISLLQELDDVSYVGLAFDRIRGEKRRSYIFKLRFDPIAGSYFVHYSCSHPSKYLRNQFERYLRDQYNVRVIPTTG